MIRLISNIYSRLFSSKEQSEPDLEVVANIAITPLGQGESMSNSVRTCRKILNKFHLDPHDHALGTNVHGPMSKIETAIRECHQALHKQGVQRIQTEITLNSRKDKKQNIDTMMAA
ncbi:MAG: MTH1187 family thiamine-binding protein [Candidatus Melainabacteria bacterium]|nr:MTH1187 family thiamine-binding protein [Candidatus Melainabacteria bacterium]